MSGHHVGTPTSYQRVLHHMCQLLPKPLAGWLRETQVVVMGSWALLGLAWMLQMGCLESAEALLLGSWGLLRWVWALLLGSLGLLQWVWALLPGPQGLL